MQAASLYVTARVVPKTSFVAYSILSGPEESGTHIKTTRFSELDAFHTRLVKEVPGFRGKLPAKTLKRRTSADFVDNRRKEIETYLRLVATDLAASTSGAWKEFLPNPEASSFTPPMESVEASGVASDLAGEESEDEVSVLENSMNDEMKELMARRRDELKEAQDTGNHLQENIQSGDATLKGIEANAREKATLEIEAGARLRSHRTMLEGLDTELAAKQVKSRDTEFQQLELSKRLTEQLGVAAAATKQSRAKFEASRRACMESAAQIRSNIAAGSARKVDAEAESAAAIERHSSMAVLLQILQERAKQRHDEVKAAERDRDVRRAANLAAIGESNEAEDLRRQAEAESTAATAAVACHNADSSRRIRAHEVEVRRAQERASKAATLRDLRTRGLVMGEDRTSLEPAESASTEAAEALHEALTRATQLRDETKARDEERKVALVAVANRAAMKLKDKDRVASALLGRVNETDSAVQASSASYAAAHAALKAVEEQLESIRHQVEGPLAKALPESATNLEEATNALAAIKKKGEENQTPLRHSEDAEAQLVKGQQQAEESLVQELDEAQMCAAEAHEDAQVFSDASFKEPQGPDVNLLVKSAAARFADHERNANNAADALKEVQAQVEATEQELKALGPRPEAADEVDENIVRRGLLEARQKDLEQLAHEKNEARKVAAEATAAAKQELEELEAKQKAAPKRALPLEKLIRDELQAVDVGLKVRQDREASIMGDFNARQQTWTTEKEVLGAGLHRAQLQAVVAEEAASGLAKSLRKPVGFRSLFGSLTR